ncbi:hypothetical protein EYF80_018751 [Liparis tanakae]|uniref:Uncharacterized protein n=1 Tax=Liparis tanakae TaxID=230148 RepID=A0A4Z2I022_9TELE|nr:hypothetical protein EYF80_018751 [Liparis tanakae]
MREGDEGPPPVRKEQTSRSEDVDAFVLCHQPHHGPWVSCDLQTKRLAGLVGCSGSYRFKLELNLKVSGGSCGLTCADAAPAEQVQQDLLHSAAASNQCCDDPDLPVTMATQVLIPHTVSVFVSTVLSLLSLALLLLLCVIRKKRRLEGTYRPSAEERKQVGSAGSEKPGLPLPLPKEERLI